MFTDIIDCLPVFTTYYSCKRVGFISKLHIHVIKYLSYSDRCHADHTVNHLFAYLPNLCGLRRRFATYILTRPTDRPVNSDAGNLTGSYPSDT